MGQNHEMGTEQPDRTWDVTPGAPVTSGHTLYLTSQPTQLSLPVLPAAQALCPPAACVAVWGPAQRTVPHVSARLPCPLMLLGGPWGSAWAGVDCGMQVGMWAQRDSGQLTGQLSFCSGEPDFHIKLPSRQ